MPRWIHAVLAALGLAFIALAPALLALWHPVLTIVLLGLFALAGAVAEPCYHRAQRRHATESRNHD